jgi:hypothetical protein
MTQAGKPIHADHDGPVEVRLTKETIQYLDSRIAAAVSKGIQEAVTDETARQFWSTGLSVLQEEATNHAGRFVVGGVMGLARKALMFLFLGSIVYALGGWAGLARLWQVLFQGPV